MTNRKNYPKLIVQVERLRFNRHRLNRTIAILFACIIIATPLNAQEPRRGTYVNPVVPGDNPDPSVIRVGADYWATATSSEWAPEFSILHSRDLINWDIQGAVFPTRPAWSDGNYWAPEIAEDKGRYYVYYVGHKKNGPLCVAVATAPRATGPYTDHGPLVCQDAGSIDAFHVRDESGRRYLIWKEDGNSRNQPTPIWAQQLTEDGTRLTGAARQLIRNDAPWEAQLVEGPAIVRRNGWFYLFYSGNACCGRECHYALGVARSRRLLGPWEKNPTNPILAGNRDWKCPGHGTVVSDARGRTWLMYHAYNARDFVYVGREALLDEVTWGSDGWPKINNGQGPGTQADAPYNVRESSADYKFFDDFTTPRSREGWQWPQANVPVFEINPRRNGWLVLSPNKEQGDNPTGAVLARPTTTGRYEATTVIDVSDLSGNESAGLAAYGDMQNALGLSTSGKRIILWSREKNVEKTFDVAAQPAGNLLYLKMRAREGHLFRFAVSNDGRSWRDVGDELDGSYLPPWDRGVRVAIVAGGRGGAGVRFGFMRIEPAP
jgi:xylan 1,4-beta-xylosidase